MSGPVLMEERRLLPYRRLKECNSWVAIKTRVTSSMTVKGLVDVLQMLSHLEYFEQSTPAFVALGQFILNGTVSHLSQTVFEVLSSRDFDSATLPVKHPMEPLCSSTAWLALQQRLKIYSPWVVVAALGATTFELIDCEGLLADEITLKRLEQSCSHTGCAKSRPLTHYARTQEEVYALFATSGLSIATVISSLNRLCCSNRVSLRTGLYLLGIWLTWGTSAVLSVVRNGLLITPFDKTTNMTRLPSLLLTRCFTDSEKRQLYLALMPFLRVDERLFYSRVCRAGRKTIFNPIWEERAMHEVLTWAVFHFDPLPISMLVDAPFHYECEGDGVSKERRQKLIDQRTIELCRNITSWHLLGARWVGRAHMVTSNKLVEEVFGRLEPVADWEITLCAQRVMHLFPGLDFRLRWSLISSEGKPFPVPEQRISPPKYGSLMSRGCVPWLRQTVLDSIANYEGLQEEFLIPFAIHGLLKESTWKSRLLDVNDPFTPPMLYYWAYSCVSSRRPFHGSSEILAFPLPSSIEKSLLSQFDLPSPRKQIAAHLELFSLADNVSKSMLSQQNLTESKSGEAMLLSLARNAIVNLADQIFDRLEHLIRRKGFAVQAGGTVSEGLTRRITLARSYYSFGAPGNLFFVADFCKCPLGFLLYC